MSEQFGLGAACANAVTGTVSAANPIIAVNRFLPRKVFIREEQGRLEIAIGILFLFIASRAEHGRNCARSCSEAAGVHSITSGVVQDRKSANEVPEDTWDIERSVIVRSAQTGARALCRVILSTSDATGLTRSGHDT